MTNPILVTGGSVAENIGAMEDYSNSNLFENDLNANWISPTGAPFRVINAAVAGAKQPGTLIQTALFSSVADYIISIEGYNEMGRMSGVYPVEEPPMIWFEYAYAFEFPLRFLVLKFSIATVRSFRNSFLRHSGVLFALSDLWLGNLNRHFEIFTMRAAPFPELGPDLPRPQAYIAGFMKYISYAQMLANAQGIPYTCFLQPVPSRYKVLTPEEKKLVGDLSIQQAYPLIIDAARALGRGVHVESLEKVFEHEREQIYTDSVHFNMPGMKLVTAKIALHMAQNQKWKRRTVE